MVDDKQESFIEDVDYEERLLISSMADKTELADNIRCAKAILHTFPNDKIIIRGHSKERDVKNPEYLINGMMADRKGIAGYKGVRNSFQSAMEQGAVIVVIDLDKHLSQVPLKTRELSRRIFWRYSDFISSRIEQCYIVFNGNATRIAKSSINSKEQIEELIKRLKP